MCTQVAQIHNHNTRQALYDLRQPPSQRNLRRWDITVLSIMPNVWNELPIELKSINSFPRFKSKAKSYYFNVQLNENF